MELAVFIGVQGAGKSTFHYQHFLNTHVRISLDLLRTRHREARFFALCLETQQRAVIDNTNPTRADRQRYLVPALAAKYRCVAYYFRCPVEVALLQNAGRLGKARVPDRAILSTAAKLEPPDWSEGFAEIFDVVPDDRGALFATKVKHGER